MTAVIELNLSTQRERVGKCVYYNSDVRALRCRESERESESERLIFNMSFGWAVAVNYPELHSDMLKTR